MTKYTIDIPEEYLNELRDSYFETEAYKDILAEVIVRDRDCATENLARTTALYKDALMRYTKVKADLELDYIRKNYPTATDWVATFGDNKLEITVAD